MPILQRFYNISDDQVEYQNNDRMSFMRFFNLTIADYVPTARLFGISENV